MNNFPTRIPNCDSYKVMLFWIYLFLLMLVFVLQWFSLHWEILTTLDYSCPNWVGLRDHLRDAPWEHIFKLGASAAASEFCEWVQVIPHSKYQVKPHSSKWCSAACATAIVHRNHFLYFYQKDKSSDSKVTFRQASNHELFISGPCI